MHEKEVEEKLYALGKQRDNDAIFSFSPLFPDVVFSYATSSSSRACKIHSEDTSFVPRRRYFI